VVAKNKNMRRKIVLLLAGQLRTFDYPSVKKSWRKFFDCYDVLTYGCFWKNRGKSVCSLMNGIQSSVDENEEVEIEKVKDIFCTDNIWLYDYNQYMNDINPAYKNYTSSHYFGCCFPQTYLRNEVCKKFAEQIPQQFDDANCFLTRPDLIWLREPPTNLFEEKSTLLHNDSPQAYHPNRVYDILLCSSKEIVLKVGMMYGDENGFFGAMNSSYNSSLHPNDICRVYYNYCVLNQIPIRGQQNLICDVLREEGDVERYQQVYTENVPLWGLC